MTRLVRTSYDPLQFSSGRSTALFAEKSLVVVDSDPDDYRHLKPVIEQHAADCYLFRCGADLLYHGLPDSMACSLVNLELSDMTGLELCELIRQRQESMPIFLVANQYDPELEAEVLTSGLGQLVCKPILPIWLRDSLLWEFSPRRPWRPLEKHIVPYQSTGEP